MSVSVMLLLLLLSLIYKTVNIVFSWVEQGGMCDI